MRYPQAILLLMGLFLLSACNDEGCTEPVTTYNVGAFEKILGSETVISSFSVYAKPDSIMISNQSDLKSFDLNLNPSTHATTFELKFQVGSVLITDTLTFYYRNREFFLSADCGCSMFHYLDSANYTGNLIQSIVITNPEITNEKRANFKLLY